MNFFEPRLSHCEGNDGKMGSEFPIIYYAAAILYKIFGFHDYFIRFINLLFFITGLLYLFKAIALFLEDTFYGFVLALMVFTSPMVIDYANNFLPDVPALSVTFIAFYFFLNFEKTKATNQLYISIFFFAFAGLLKVTALMGFLAIVATMLLGFIFRIATNKQEYWNTNKKQLLAFITIPLIVSALWILYIKQYNLANHNKYFLTTIVPIWSLDDESIKQVWGSFQYIWLREFIYRDFTNCMPFVFLLCFFIPNRKNIFALLFLFLLIAAGILHVLLFFGQFLVHDYYLISLIPIPIAICTIFLLRLKGWKPAIVNSTGMKSAVLILLLVMIYHGQRIYTIREKSESWSYYNDFYKMENVVDSIGIKTTDKVMSIGDFSSGMSLYFINRRGFTSMMFTPPKATKKDFEYCISKGAKYVLISDSGEEYITEDAKKLYLKTEMINVDGVKFYKL